MQEQAGEAGPAAERIARARQGSTAGQPVDFPAEAGSCPRCGAALRIQKSKRRRVATLATRTIEARETRKHCAQCPSLPVAVSRQLAALAPPRQRYGYDLIVRVGLARYHGHQQRGGDPRGSGPAGDPAGGRLRVGTLRSLPASPRSAASAVRPRPARGHGQRLPLAPRRHQRPGQGRCVPVPGRVARLGAARGEGLLRERRGAAAGDREHAGCLWSAGRLHARPGQRGSEGGCGLPGPRDPRPGLPLCHYHFLAAVGKKLLDVEGRKHLPYPFALPHWDFYRRCGQFWRQAQRRLPRPRSRIEQRTLRRADAVLAALGRAGRIAWAVPRLERNWSVFNELRDVLRLRDDELPHGNRGGPSAPRSPASVTIRLQAIASATQAYKHRLRQRVAAQPAAAVPDPLPEAVVLGYLERYSDSLYGHPVALDSAGRVVHVVARTNNVAEHFFATAKQKLRRRLGRAHLGRDMQDQPAQAALAANLLCSEYVRIVCGALDRLPQAFAELDPQALAATTPLQRNNRDAKLHRRNRAWAADS